MCTDNDELLKHAKRDYYLILRYEVDLSDKAFNYIVKKYAMTPDQIMTFKELLDNFDD
jgi:hypothetical protein